MECRKKVLERWCSLRGVLNFCKKSGSGTQKKATNHWSYISHSVILWPNSTFLYFSIQWKEFKLYLSQEKVDTPKIELNFFAFSAKHFLWFFPRVKCVPKLHASFSLFLWQQKRKSSQVLNINVALHRSLGWCERKPPRAYRVSVEIALGLK